MTRIVCRLRQSILVQEQETCAVAMSGLGMGRCSSGKLLWRFKLSHEAVRARKAVGRGQDRDGHALVGAQLQLGRLHDEPQVGRLPLDLHIGVRILQHPIQIYAVLVPACCLHNSETPFSSAVPAQEVSSYAACTDAVRQVEWGSEWTWYPSASQSWISPPMGLKGPSLSRAAVKYWTLVG